MFFVHHTFLSFRESYLPRRTAAPQKRNEAHGEKCPSKVNVIKFIGKKFLNIINRHCSHCHVHTRLNVMCTTTGNVSSTIWYFLILLLHLSIVCGGTCVSNNHGVPLSSCSSSLSLCWVYLPYILLHVFTSLWLLNFRWNFKTHRKGVTQKMFLLTSTLVNNQLKERREKIFRKKGRDD